MSLRGSIAIWLLSHTEKGSWNTASKKDDGRHHLATQWLYFKYSLWPVSCGPCLNPAAGADYISKRIADRAGDDRATSEGMGAEVRVFETFDTEGKDPLVNKYKVQYLKIKGRVWIECASFVEDIPLIAVDCIAIARLPAATVNHTRRFCDWTCHISASHRCQWL
jgi:hypothetical protein